MRILFLIGALCFASAGNAFAIKTPSEDEVNDIQEQMFVGNRMDKEVVEAADALSAAKDAKASDAEILRLKKSLAREKDKQNAARTKAMHMAILAYGLEPANWSGTGVMPSTKGRTIKWLPRVRESEDHEVRVGGEVLGTIKKDKTGYVGITYMDGVTIMDASAFENGPGYLASYILHERIHFEQFTTRGKGDVMSTAEAQEAAYQAQVDNAEHFFNPKVPAELSLMRGIEGERDKEKAAADLEKKESATILGRLRGLLPRSRRPDYFDAKIHTNAELADISGLVAQARSQADIARREREKREAIARAAAEKAAHLDHDERLRITVADLALRSCANPGSVTQAELDGLPKPHDPDYKSGGTFPPGLNTCALHLYFSIDNGADAEEIRKQSLPLQPAVFPPPEEKPLDVRAKQPSGPTPAVAKTLFSAVFPELKAFAVKACGIANLVPVDKNLTAPSRPFYFLKGVDDPIADKLAAGMGYCEERLFRRLIEKIRNGHGGEITARWVQEAAAQYRSEAGTNSGNSPTQTGGGDPCRDRGNIRCP